MSERITSANIDDVIEKNKHIELEIQRQVLLIQTNQQIMKVASIPQLAIIILKSFGLIQLPIDDLFYSGAIYVKEGKRIPYINTALPRVNQYFAAWHEVYHLVFDKVYLDHYIEIDNTIEERKAECFAAHMLLSGVDQYFYSLLEEDFLSKIFCCMSTFQAPFKAVLIALYENAVKSDNDRLKEKIQSVLDLRIDDIPQKFKALGLDDSLVLPSNVINILPLQEKISMKCKANPELEFHKDNEEHLKKIATEIALLSREN